jgi:hypothetical protein
MRIERSSVPLHVRLMLRTGREYADTASANQRRNPLRMITVDPLWKRRNLLRAAFALFVCVAPLWALAVAPSAQGRPNFTGEWIATSTAGDATARPFFAGTDRNGHMTIAQDARTLVIAWVSYSRSHQPVQAVANLDGSERRFVDRNSVEPQERTTRARWVGAQLIVTTTWAGRGPGTSSPSPVETDETLSFESAATLKVRVTRRSGDQVWTSTRTFRRQ